jgi:hypothetical protein
MDCSDETKKDPDPPEFTFCTNNCGAPGIWTVWLEFYSPDCDKIKTGDPPNDGYWFEIVLTPDPGNPVITANPSTPIAD